MSMIMVLFKHIKYIDKTGRVIGGRRTSVPTKKICAICAHRNAYAPSPKTFSLCKISYTLFRGIHNIMNKNGTVCQVFSITFKT